MCHQRVGLQMALAPRTVTAVVTAQTRPPTVAVARVKEELRRLERAGITLRGAAEVKASRRNVPKAQWTRALRNSWVKRVRPMGKSVGPTTAVADAQLSALMERGFLSKKSYVSKCPTASTCIGLR